MTQYISKLEAALSYAAKGIPIFPMYPKTKMPACGWKSGQSTDPDQITNWWTTNTDYELAVVTGEKSGIAVVDVDTPEAWALVNERGLPDGPVVKTGKGYHIYCKHENGIRNFQKRADLPGIDLRGEGGYVVAPPSVHECGDIYAWIDGKTLDDFEELPPIPEWVLARNSGEKQPIEELLNGVGDGQRNIALTRLVGHWLNQGASYKQIVKNSLDWNQKNNPPEEHVSKIMATINSIYKREHGSVPGVEQEWQEPILFDGVDVAEIKADLLPSWLCEHAHAVSQSTQTSEALAVMVGLSAIATCVQKKFVISPNRDDYVEPLCIWTVSVLQSSERKTPVFKAMTAPIYAWEKEQAQLLEPQIVETASIRLIEQKRIDKLQQDAVSTADAIDRQRIIREIGQINDGMPDVIHTPRLWVGDTTPESLQDLLADNDEKMAVLADEGGIFEIMAGLYSDNKVNIDIFLQAYSGSPARIHRKNRQVSLESPTLTFGLAVQPAVIESLGMGSKKALRGKGALGRFLFCFPQSMMGNRDVRRDYPVPANVKLAYQQGVNRLLNIQDVVDESGAVIPRVLRLHPEALELWHEFSEYVEEKLGPGGELASMTDWGGKLPGNALRIAGLMHLVEKEPDDILVLEETMENALELCSLLVSHAKMAFGIIGVDETIGGARKIYRWMQRNGFEGFSKTTCQRGLHGSIPTADKLDRSLIVLEERHIVRKHKIETGGRPSECYEVNPALKQK